MSAARSATSRGWCALDDALALRRRLEAGLLVVVTAEQIRRIGRREPRLMTKWDTRESRPPELKGVTILPVTNGRYVLLEGDGYHDVEEPAETRFWPLPSAAARLSTLPWQEGPASESQAIDMAAASGVLHDFLGERELHLTVRGRLRSPTFDYVFARRRGGHEQTCRLAVEGVQIEVDAGFEGRAVHLIEAKLGGRTNLHLRQLYYPFRMWQSRLGHKPVTSVFLTWSNRCVSLRQYDFDPADCYHGLRLGRAIDYVLEEEPQRPTLGEVLAHTELQALPDVPFPQADDLRKVVDVVDAVGAGVRTRSALAARADFDERQADYYGNAAVFLGLIRREPSGFSLTPGLGQRFFRANRGQRSRLLVDRIAGLPVYRPCLTHRLREGELPDRQRVAAYIAEQVGLTGTTPNRRAATVLRWLRWLLSHCHAP